MATPSTLTVNVARPRAAVQIRSSVGSPMTTSSAPASRGRRLRSTLQVLLVGDGCDDEPSALLAAGRGETSATST